jgi:hypothetical protein
MSLFNSQTIFSILITLLIGVGLYYYIKYKYRVLELTQREQAKVLQSVIMSMNSNNENILSMVNNRSQEEIIDNSVNHDINRFQQVNSSNELIDVSDDSDSDDSDSDESDESDESSESSESGSECDSDHEDNHNHNHNHEHEDEVTDNNTRKILFTGNNDSHLVEHLDGPDVKVIELTHPLYPKHNNEDYDNKDDRNNDNDYEDDDDNNDDDDEDSDSESLPSDIDGPHESSVEDEKHESGEIKENVVINEMNNQNTKNIKIDLETDIIAEVISVDNSLDNLSVKTVFKTKDNKDSETHSDYNSMNVQSLRQLLKNKLSMEGASMSESSINKLTKKDLIKNLS